MKLKQKLTTRYTRARLNILSLVSPRKSALKAFRIFCRPRGRINQKPAIFETGEPLSFRFDSHTIRGHRWQPYSDALRPSASDTVKKVLVVHGFESSSCVFDQYIAAMLKKGYEVVAFDAPAHGRSGGKRLYVSDYSRMLTRIGQTYGPFQSWLAHSLGGLALVLALEDAPPEGRGSVALLAPAPGIEQAVGQWAERHRLPVEVVAEMDEHVREVCGHPFAWYSLRRAIGAVAADILYVQDEEDAVVPADEAKRIREDGHAQVRFLFTTGLGHKKLYRDQEVLDAVVAFL